MLPVFDNINDKMHIRMVICKNSDIDESIISIMMTLSNGKIFRLPVTNEFPARRPVTRSLDVFSFICAWINGWVNNREAGDLRRSSAHCDVIVICMAVFTPN